MASPTDTSTNPSSTTITPPTLTTDQFLTNLARLQADKMNSGSIDPQFSDPVKTIPLWQTNAIPNGVVPTSGVAVLYPNISFENQSNAFWDDPNYLTPQEKGWIAAQAQAWYGYSTPIGSDQERGFWNTAFATAALHDVPVYDVMAEMVHKRQTADAASSSGSGSSFGGTRVSYNYTTPQVAKALINSSLTTYLGRAATPDEIKTFTEALKNQESENPTIVTSSGDSSTQTGGFSSEIFAKDYANQQEGAAEYQASTRYLDLFLGALG